MDQFGHIISILEKTCREYRYASQQNLFENDPLPPLKFSLQRWTTAEKRETTAPDLSAKSLVSRSANSAHPAKSANYLPSLKSGKHLLQAERYRGRKSQLKKRPVRPKLKPASECVGRLQLQDILEYRLGELHSFIETSVLEEPSVKRWTVIAGLSASRLSSSISNFVLYAVTREGSYVYGFHGTRYPKAVFVRIVRRVCEWLQSHYEDRAALFKSLEEHLLASGELLVCNNLMADLGGARIVESLFNEYIEWLRNEALLQNFCRVVGFGQDFKQWAHEAVLEFLRETRPRAARLASRVSLSQTEFLVMKSNLFKLLMSRGHYDFVILRIFSLLQPLKQGFVEPLGKAEECDLILAHQKSIVRDIQSNKRAGQVRAKAAFPRQFVRFLELAFAAKDLGAAARLLLDMEGDNSRLLLELFREALERQFKEEAGARIEGAIACNKLQVRLGHRSNLLGRLKSAGLELYQVLDSLGPRAKESALICELLKVFPQQKYNLQFDEENPGLYHLLMLTSMYLAPQYCISYGEVVSLLKVAKAGRFTPALWCQLFLLAAQQHKDHADLFLDLHREMQALFKALDIYFVLESS